MTRILTKSDFKDMPWKNGRGMTTEFYRRNDRGEMVFRISSATLSESGPFSDFTGYDRTLVNLGPGPMHVSFHDSNELFLELNSVGHFDGGIAANCHIEAATRDLNVFCRRGQYFASTFIRTLTKPEFLPLTPTDNLFIFVAAGSLVVHDLARQEYLAHENEAILRESRDGLTPDRWMIASASEAPAVFVMVVFRQLDSNN